MDLLVLTPPVHTPSEPAAGAFLLAAGLAGHGIDAGLLDLSLELYWHELEREGPRDSIAKRDAAAVDYLCGEASGYAPDAHRTAAGQLHVRLKRFGERHPGWRLSFMDLIPPVRVHNPAALGAWLDSNKSPFEGLFEGPLATTLAEERPRRVVISLAYLAQLPAAMALSRYLAKNGVPYTVGGSLPRSLAATGMGLDALSENVGPLDLSDGSTLLGARGSARLLDRLAWPKLLSRRPYLTARPIVPLSLSEGCYWRRCQFCPDRQKPYQGVPLAAVRDLLESMPESVRAARPVIHLLDSAIPIGPLRSFLPMARSLDLRFYGFARPTRHFDDTLSQACADSGCLMLQLGVEGGSGELLSRFDKGIVPEEAERAVSSLAAAGIRTYLYLLFGLPGETAADREATLELLKRNAPSVDFLNTSLFNLPRVCELIDRADEHGIALGEFPTTGDLIQLYRPFSCQGEDPREAARAFLKETLFEHPDVRPAVLRTPRWFRAAHLALMKLPGRQNP